MVAPVYMMGRDGGMDGHHNVMDGHHNVMDGWDGTGCRVTWGDDGRGGRRVFTWYHVDGEGAAEGMARKASDDGEGRSGGREGFDVGLTR